MPTRLKGQETTITVISKTNGVEPAFSDVKSFEVQFDREILSEDYLGQTTSQKDDIFNGVSGRIEIHSRTADILSLVERINLVSKRRLPGEQIQIASTLRFPLGGSRRLVFGPCAFGNIPVNISGRAEFVTFTLEFASDDGRILPAP